MWAAVIVDPDDFCYTLFSIVNREITQMSKRLPLLSEELEEKEMRWLELSEFA